MGAPAVVVERLRAKYPPSRDWVLKDINLEVRRGEMLVVMGPSGCGKSTLLNVIAGLMPSVIPGVVEGRVIVDGVDVLAAGHRGLVGRVAMVYQNPEVQVITRSVYEELAMAPENLGLPKDEVVERVEWALDVLGLRGYEHKDPQALSGGEKQLIAIASVLTMRPKILLLDEPTSMLDHRGTRMVLSAINALKKRGELTVIVAEHRVEWAVEVADKVAIMSGGRLVLEGTPDEVFSRVDEIRELGVRPPGVAEVAYELIRRGAKVPVPVHLEDAVKALGGGAP